MSEFPQDWTLVPLEKIVRRNSPIVYGIVQAGEHIDDGIPYIRVSDMTKGYLSLDGMLRTSTEIAEKYSRSVVNENDIVFALRGQAGLVLQIPAVLDGANLTQGTARISPNEKVDTSYLVHAIGSEFVQKDILRRLRGSTFKEIPLYEVRKIKIPLPPIEEQLMIADILGTWDEAIALTERLISALNTRKKGLMQKLLTGEVRFSEFDGEWEEVKLEDVGDMTSSKRIYKNDYVDFGIPFYRGQEITSLINGEEIVNPYYISEEKFNTLKNKFGAPNKGDILITAVGTLGNIYIVPDEDDFYFKDGNIIWLREIQHANPSFLAYKLQDSKRQILKTSIGSSQKALTIVALRSVKVLLPSQAEQKSIIKVLKDTDNEIYFLYRYYVKLQEQKKGLMQQLLTGQVRVKS